MAKRRRYNVRHTYTDAHGKTRTGVASILATDANQAKEHARTHILNIGKVLGVTERGRGPRW